MSPRVEDWMDETIDIGTFRGFSVALQKRLFVAGAEPPDVSSRTQAYRLQ